MKLSPALQEAIAQLALDQGISPKEFIIKTLTEKVESLRSAISSSPNHQVGLTEKEGILVFETESLDHIDFNALTAQSRADYLNLKAELFKRASVTSLYTQIVEFQASKSEP